VRSVPFRRKGFDPILKRETIEMRTRLYSLSNKLPNLLLSDDGQDLVEYALVVALIAFAAVSSMQTLASDINNAFANVGNSLANFTA
jgi:pilus assembly protein Flp/PilA